jgi:hypothetical protein
LLLVSLVAWVYHSFGRINMPRGGPGISKRVWFAEEDARLTKLVRKIGTRKKSDLRLSWISIATELGGGRNHKQCRERWHHHLDPAVKKGRWTPAEDAIIIDQQKTLGNQWARISEHLVGRTPMAVKNRWATFVRSAQRKKGMETIMRSSGEVSPMHVMCHVVSDYEDDADEAIAPHGDAAADTDTDADDVATVAPQLNDEALQWLAKAGEREREGVDLWGSEFVNLHTDGHVDDDGW